MDVTIREISSKGLDFELAKEIRYNVFIVEQKVSAEEEYDEFEDTSVHYLAYHNNEPAGTCRFRKTEKGIKLERFAVLKKHRLKNVGSVLVQACLKALLNESYIYLHAQVDAMPLYKKNGFEAYGDIFYECKIPHYAMKYKPNKL